MRRTKDEQEKNGFPTLDVTEEEEIFARGGNKTRKIWGGSGVVRRNYNASSSSAPAHLDTHSSSIYEFLFIFFVHFSASYIVTDFLTSSEWERILFLFFFCFTLGRRHRRLPGFSALTS